jgi:hypothetical protein
LTSVFFIGRADSNSASPRGRVSAVEGLLSQAFSVFFDSAPMQYTLDFCSEMGRSVRSYDLGFVPTQDVVRLVRHVGLD